MSLSDSVYYTSSGSTSGLKVTLSGSGTDTTINMGRSFIDKMVDFATEAVKFGNDIDTRVTLYNADVTSYSDELADFQSQMETLTKKYTDQFAAMDLAIASMNGTKASLTSMMDAWKGSMS
jgi:flagellar capping protein FliD